jgi:hypothetical protein
MNTVSDDPVSPEWQSFYVTVGVDGCTLTPKAPYGEKALSTTLEYNKDTPISGLKGDVKLRATPVYATLLGDGVAVTVPEPGVRRAAGGACSRKKSGGADADTPAPAFALLTPTRADDITFPASITKRRLFAANRSKQILTILYAPLAAEGKWPPPDLKAMQKAKHQDEKHEALLREPDTVILSPNEESERLSRFLDDVSQYELFGDGTSSRLVLMGKFSDEDGVLETESLLLAAMNVLEGTRHFVGLLGYEAAVLNTPTAPKHGHVMWMVYLKDYVNTINSMRFEAPDAAAIFTPENRHAISYLWRLQDLYGFQMLDWHRNVMVPKNQKPSGFKIIDMGAAEIDPATIKETKKHSTNDWALPLVDAWQRWHDHTLSKRGEEDGEDVPPKPDIEEAKNLLYSAGFTLSVVSLAKTVTGGRRPQSRLNRRTPDADASALARARIRGRLCDSLARPTSKCTGLKQRATGAHAMPSRSTGRSNSRRRGAQARGTGRLG